MTRWATLAIALLFCRHRRLQYTDTASGQAGGGWITLFDGKNLDQWQGDGTATFKIEDGSVIAIDKKDPKAVAAYLVSKQSFKDFELRAEFWVSDDANSGIFIRAAIRRRSAARPATSSTSSTSAPIRPTAPASSSMSPRSTRAARPAASGAPWRSPPKAAISPSRSTARRPSTAREAVRQGPHRAAVRRRHGEIPQGRDQAAVGAEPFMLHGEARCEAARLDA